MPNSIVIYKSDGMYEPGQRYYLDDIADGGQVIGEFLADALESFTAISWVFTRWVLLDPAGEKFDEGSLNSQPGTATGDALTPKYCSFWRLQSAGPGRPSSKYNHGITEAFSGPGGVPTSGYITALGALLVALQAISAVDSDGSSITGVLHRSFTRRRHVRRLGE